MDKYFKISFFTSLILFGLGQAGRIFIPGQPIYFYLYEIPFIAGLIILFIKFKLQPFKENNKTNNLILIFLGWLAASYVLQIANYTFQENIVSFLYLARLASYFIYFVYLLYFFRHKTKSFILSTPITLFSLWVIITSFIQYFLYPNIGNIAYLGWDPHLMRGVGVFLEPPLAASIFFLIFIYHANLLLIKKGFFSTAIVFCAFILVVLTYSRGAYIALCTVSLILFIRSKRLFIGLLIGVLVVLSIFVLSNSQIESLNLMRTSSISSRLLDYKQGFEIWQKSPISGIGYNRIRYEKTKYINDVFVEDYNPSHGISSFHSSFLTVLVTSGVLGFTIFIAILLLIARENLYSLSIVLFMSTISLFDNILLHPYILFLFPIFLVSYPVRKSV